MRDETQGLWIRTTKGEERQIKQSKLTSVSQTCTIHLCTVDVQL